MNARQEFLMRMYDQMCSEIDRHHKIVWETMGLLIGAFAVLALSEKGIISIDIATSIIVLLDTWVVAHVYDSNYWYNRNMAIVTNIEREFLRQDDLKKIHYYFGKHRDSNALQTSLTIQLVFAILVILLFLIYHFSKSLVPGFSSSFAWENIRIEKAIPYITIAVGSIIVWWLKRKRHCDYTEFLQNSPGIPVDTSGITYGSGHPTSIEIAKK